MTKTRVVWELAFRRTDAETDQDTSYETHVYGPAPLADAASWRCIPDDVRAFAQVNGRANRADAVSYRTAHLADCTGYAETGAVEQYPTVWTWHDDEPIDNPRSDDPTR